MTDRRRIVHGRPGTVLAVYGAMPSFVLVARTHQAALPPGLELLDAEIAVDEPSAPGELVGRADGCLVDETGDVVALVIRLAPRNSGTQRPWTIVPTAGLEVDGPGRVRVAWTEDQLLAQPRFDAWLQPHDRIEGGPPVESHWMPAQQSVVPPGTGVNAPEAVREGAAGGAIGAALGAIAGLAVAGPAAAAGLAFFFGAGGVLAGLLSGASHDSAIQAGELDLERDGRTGATHSALERLADRLRDREMLAHASLHVTRFDLVTDDGRTWKKAG